MSFRGKEFVIIDGVTSDSFGVYVKDRPPVPTAERDVEHIEVRGRDGSLTKIYGYKDVVYTITLHMYEDGEQAFMPSFRAIKQRVINAKTLAFSDDLDVYRKVKHVSILEAYNPTKEFGRFDVVFTLDPFNYEVDNDWLSVSKGMTIDNEGYVAMPIIEAQASGIGHLFINEQEIVINDINGSITIDSESQNAYRKSSAGAITENLNKHMIGEFPIIQTGKNVIDYSGALSNVKIKLNKRWL